MELLLNTLRDTALYVLETLRHNALVLLFGVVIASALQVYVDTARMKRWLTNRASLSIPATVAFGAFTPFCACGTMAVVLGMLASALPWGAIMAFLTSSPLMSPDEFVVISGILGVRFALALTAASVLIGLGAGFLANFLQKRTDFFSGQLRFSAANESPAPSCGCGGAVPAASAASSGKSAVRCCSAVPAACCAAPAACRSDARENPFAGMSTFFKRIKLDQLAKSVFDIGIRKILPLFALFAAIGFLVNRFVPASWISAVFGAKNAFAVPLAAAVGLPLYVSGSAAVPLMETLLNSGVTPGAMLAFMINGPGTSAGVLAGISAILKRRALAYYVGCLLAGAVALGYLYDAVLLLF
jgi:uncharacterized protein